MVFGDDITQLGVGGILVILILREVFNFLSKRRGSDIEKLFEKMSKQVDQLYRWHDVRDLDGVPVWYVKRSLQVSIEKLTESIDKLHDVIQNMQTEMKLSREIKRVGGT